MRTLLELFMFTGALFWLCVAFALAFVVGVLAHEAVLSARLVRRVLPHLKTVGRRAAARRALRLWWSFMHSRPDRVWIGGRVVAYGISPGGRRAEAEDRAE